jgi:beta-lactamase class A
MVTAACGAEITVHRLIGDARAEAGGLTNTVTARGLGLLLCALVTGTLLPAEATHHALELLTRQKHRRMIPAGLPPGTWSASKGGWTAAVRHDVALVRPDDAPAYVLAVCTTTGLDDAADGLVARLSTVTWEHWSQWHAS